MWNPLNSHRETQRYNLGETMRCSRETKGMHKTDKTGSYSTFSFSGSASKTHLVIGHHKGGQRIEVPGHSTAWIYRADGLGEAQRRPPSE